MTNDEVRQPYVPTMLGMLKVLEDALCTPLTPEERARVAQAVKGYDLTRVGQVTTELIMDALNAGFAGQCPAVEYTAIRLTQPEDKGADS